MKLEEIKKEEMAALESLANANVQIGKAKAALVTLKKEEAEYIYGREKEVEKKVEGVLANSKKALKESKENWAELKVLADTTKSLAAFVTETQEELVKTIGSFKEKQKAWDADLTTRENESREVLKDIQVQKKEIEKETKKIQEANKEIEKEHLRLKDERGTLARAIQRLNNNRV